MFPCDNRVPVRVGALCLLRGGGAEFGGRTRACQWSELQEELYSAAEVVAEKGVLTKASTLCSASVLTTLLLSTSNAIYFLCPPVRSNFLSCQVPGGVFLALLRHRAPTGQMGSSRR